MRDDGPVVSGEPVALEPMTLEDLDDVLAIERASFQTPWSRGAFRYELTQNRVARCSVVRCGRRLAGYLCLWEIGHEIHITNLAVHPDFRRRGMARALLGAVLEDARRRGVGLAFLEVRPTNAEALGLYESFGFRVIGRRKGYYFDTGEDALVMEARLSAEPSESAAPRRPGA
jgi:[ribosomal protein S18]-alanine N-acetyltransferase